MRHRKKRLFTFLFASIFLFIFPSSLWSSNSVDLRELKLDKHDRNPNIWSLSRSDRDALIKDQNEELKKQDSLLREFQKELKKQHNEHIILKGDLKKQGYKYTTLSEEISRQRYMRTLMGLVLILTLAFIFMMIRNARSKQTYLHLLEAEKEEVSVQKELVSVQKEQTEKVLADLTDSIRYAMRIQNAVLPDLPSMAKIIDSEFFILFKPKDIVSGDFYFIEKRGDWLVAAVADCTGHGVPGALLSMLAITMLNDVVLKKEDLRAGDILDELREKMIVSMQRKGLMKDQGDGLDISLLLLNRKLMKGQWAGANTPLVQIHKKDKSLKEVKADKRPIGLYPDMGHFTNHEFKLQKGDKFFLFSDGYADQFGGEKDKKFMKKRFKETLVQSAHLSMPEQKTILENSFQSWVRFGKQEVAQIDDITVFGIEI